MNHSLTRVVVAVIAIALIGAGCIKVPTQRVAVQSSKSAAKPLPVPPEVEREDFETFSIHNFSFEYPNGWEVGAQESGGITSYVINDPLENVKSSGLSASVTFSPQQKSPGTETEAMREAFIKELAQAKQNPEAAVSDLKEFTLNGRRGWWFSSTIDFTSNSGQEYGIMTITFLADADNTTFYRWRVWGSEESIQKNIGKIYRIINSVKIK